MSGSKTKAFLEDAASMLMLHITYNAITAEREHVMKVLTVLPLRTPF